MSPTIGGITRRAWFCACTAPAKVVFTLLAFLFLYRSGNGYMFLFFVAFRSDPVGAFLGSPKTCCYALRVDLKTTTGVTVRTRFFSRLGTCRLDSDAL